MSEQTSAIENLTMGEIATVEDLSGSPIDALNNPDMPKTRMFMALAVVMRRRTEPKTTLADIEGMTFAQVAEELGLSTDEA